MENAEFIRHARKEDTGMIAGMMGMHAQFTILMRRWSWLQRTAGRRGYHIHVAEGSKICIIV